MDATMLGAFVANTFSGLLSHRNIVSLAKFLAKQHKVSTGQPAETFYYILTQTLAKESFFMNHLSVSRVFMVGSFFEVLEQMEDRAFANLLIGNETMDLEQVKADLMQ